MFTGIIEAVGTLQKIAGNSFTFAHPFGNADLKIGDSIAVNGMCVTVTSFSQEFFEADIIEESRNRTVFGNISEGDRVNLERSARIGDRNSGHNVSGHIDETGKILEISEQSDFWLLRMGFSEEFFPNVIFKGSIAIDGISLTVSNVSKIPENCWFEVSIIPHTWEHTNLHAQKVGDSVNLEFDQIGKYILRSQLLSQ